MSSPPPSAGSQGGCDLQPLVSFDLPGVVPLASDLDGSSPDKAASLERLQDCTPGAVVAHTPETALVPADDQARLEELLSISAGRAADGTSFEDAFLKKGVMRRMRRNIHSAIQRGQSRVVAQRCRELFGMPSIDESSKTSYACTWSETPLMVAAQAFHLPAKIQVEMVETLLRSGARLDATDPAGRTPLTLCILADPHSYRAKIPKGPPRHIWLERGADVLVRHSTDKTRWDPGVVKWCRPDALVRGGLIVCDVDMGQTVLRSIPPQDICDEKLWPTTNIELGSHVVVQRVAGGEWRSAVVTSIGKNEGCDVIFVDGQGLPTGADSLLEGVPVESLRYNLSTQFRTTETPTTEGLLYTGARVRVFLPGWTRWRRGLINGRDIGGYNVVLERSHSGMRGLDLLRSTATDKGSERKWVKYMKSKPPATKEADAYSEAVLTDVDIRCLRIDHEKIALEPNPSRTMMLVEMLTTERRRSGDGEWMTERNFISRAWSEAKETARSPPDGIMGGNVRRLVGSHAIATATRQSNIHALVTLKRIYGLKDQEDLTDWVDDREMLTFINDPEVLSFFHSFSAPYRLARAVRCACTGNERVWRPVISEMITRKQEDPWLWSATSPTEGNGLTAVAWACWYGKLELLELLLECPSSTALVRQRPARACNDLLYLVAKAACMESVKLEMCELLVEKGVPVEGSRGLHSALAENLPRLVTFFIEKGMEPDLAIDGVRAVEMASSAGAIIALEDALTNCSQDRGRVNLLPVTAVRRALESNRGRAEWIKVLERLTKGLNAWDEEGETALTRAVQAEDEELVALLISKGCDPNVQRTDGRHPVSLATQHNKFIDVLRSLLDSPMCHITGTHAAANVCRRAHVELFETLCEYERDDMGGIAVDWHEVGELPSDSSNRTPFQELLDHCKTDPAGVARMCKALVVRDVTLPSEAFYVLPDEYLREIATKDARLPMFVGNMSTVHFAISNGNCELLDHMLHMKSTAVWDLDVSGVNVVVAAIRHAVQGAGSSDHSARCKTVLRMLTLLADHNPQEFAYMLRGAGVLAEAAQCDDAGVIDYIIDKGKDAAIVWRQEDEDVIDKRTATRVSPVSLARSYCVQCRFIHHLGFSPNFANLVYEGKLRLALRAVELQAADGNRSKLTKFLVEESDVPGEEPRHFLTWLLSRPTTVAGGVQRGACYRRVCPKVVEMYPGRHFERDAWVMGHASAELLESEVASGESSRGRPMHEDLDEQSSRLVAWRMKGTSSSDPVIVCPVSELVWAEDCHPPNEHHAGALCLCPETNTDGVYKAVRALERLGDSKGSRWLTAQGAPNTVVSAHAALSETTSTLQRIVRRVDMSVDDFLTRLLNFPAARDVIQSAFNGSEFGIFEHIAVDGDGMMFRRALNLCKKVTDVESPSMSKNASPMLVSPARGSSMHPIMNAPYAEAVCSAAAVGNVGVVRAVLEEDESKRDKKGFYTKNGRGAGYWAMSRPVFRELFYAWSTRTKERDRTVEAIKHQFSVSNLAARGWTQELTYVLNMAEGRFLVEAATLGKDTPLMSAAAGGQIEAFRILLDRGSPVCAVDGRGRSVLTVLAGACQNSEASAHNHALEMATHLLSQLPDERFNSKAVLSDTTVYTSPHTEDDDVQPYASAGVYVMPQATKDYPFRTAFVQRSRALSAALAAPAPHPEMVRLLLLKGAQPDESMNGVSAVCRLSPSPKVEVVANMMVRQLLTCVVSAAALPEAGGPWIVRGWQGGLYCVNSAGAGCTTSLRYFAETDLKFEYEGPKSRGRMLQTDFTHIVSLGLPDVVKTMIDLGAIDWYSMRTQPYVSAQTLMQTLGHCLHVLDRAWRSQTSRRLALYEADDPPEWNILQQLLCGLYNVHEGRRGVPNKGPTLRQAVNNLLNDKLATLEKIPLYLYRRAVLCEQSAFLGELFAQHQVQLRNRICEDYWETLSALDTNDLPAKTNITALNERLEDNFKVMKVLARRCEMEKEGMLGIAADKGWARLVIWLLEEGVQPDASNTADYPIQSVLQVVCVMRRELKARVLSYMTNRGTFTCNNYVELMRERDIAGVRYVFQDSHDDTLLECCVNSKTLRALIQTAWALLSYGADATPTTLRSLSHCVRLDRTFHAHLRMTPDGEPVLCGDVTLLHTAAHCNNAEAVRWLLENEAYSDTVGSGLMEDDLGRTARHYTTSHACHLILAQHEQMLTQTHGFMPPLEKIDLVIAVHTVTSFNSKFLAGLEGLVNETNTSAPGAKQGVSEIIHALNTLDLAGYIVRVPKTNTAPKDANAKAAADGAAYNDSSSDDEDADVYVAVSGTDERHRRHLERDRSARTGGGHGLLSKDRNRVGMKITSSFAWPVLEQQLTGASEQLEESLTAAMVKGELHRYRTFISARMWQHHGCWVGFEERLKVVGDHDMDFAGKGDYTLVVDVADFDEFASPIWRCNDGRHVLKDIMGRWYIVRDDEPCARSASDHDGLAPSDPKLVWQTRRQTSSKRVSVWVEATSIHVRRDPTVDSCRWMWFVRQQCSHPLYALVLDADPPGRMQQKHEMRELLRQMIRELPDGMPTVISIHAPAFPDISGKYRRIERTNEGLDMIWASVEKPNKYSLHVRYTCDPDATADCDGITYKLASETNPGGKIPSAEWVIYSTEDAGEQKERLYMRCEDDAPWHMEGGGTWLNYGVSTPTPPLEFKVLTWSTDDAVIAASMKPEWENDEALACSYCREQLERKSRAMWSLRQLLRGAGAKDDVLPFNTVGRLQPDARALYRPPDFDSGGVVPPGHDWLDYLRGEGHITTVFGMPGTGEINDVMSHWRPNINYFGYSAFLKPWLWEPFKSLSEYFCEYRNREVEERYDPTTQRVCPRKVFLALEPKEKHLSSDWPELEIVHYAREKAPLLRNLPAGELCKYEQDNIQDWDAEAHKHDTWLHPGDRVLVVNTASTREGWVEVQRADTMWWLRMQEGDRTYLKPHEAKKDGVYKAQMRLHYYCDVWDNDRRVRRVADHVEPLERGAETVVIHTDLLGEWAQVRHHKHCVHLERYYLPVIDRTRSHTHVLRPPYLTPLCSLERYLGSKSTFYFAFAAYYCAFLLLLVLSGSCLTVVQAVMGLGEAQKVVHWNGLIVLVWGSMFRQLWQRKTSELAFIWGVENVEEWEPASAEFMKRNAALEKWQNPITGLSEPKFTPKQRRARYVVSISLTLLCAGFVVLVMYLNVVLRDMVAEADEALLYVMAIENALTIEILDAGTTRLTKVLATYEMHRTTSSKQYSTIMKSFIFRFINAMSGLVVTALVEPRAVCECARECHTSCRYTAEDLTRMGTAEAMSMMTECPPYEEISECVAYERTKSLMIQLTAQFIIGTLLSLVTEKLIPLFTWHAKARQIKQTKSTTKSLFPAQIDGFVLKLVEDAPDCVKKYSANKYVIVCQGPLRMLKVSSMSGVWEECDKDGNRRSSLENPARFLITGTGRLQIVRCTTYEPGTNLTYAFSLEDQVVLYDTTERGDGAKGPAPGAKTGKLEGDEYESKGDTGNDHMPFKLKRVSATDKYCFLATFGSPSDETPSERYLRRVCCAFTMTCSAVKRVTLSDQTKQDLGVDKESRYFEWVSSPDDPLKVDMKELRNVNRQLKNIGKGAVQSSDDDTYSGVSQFRSPSDILNGDKAELQTYDAQIVNRLHFLAIGGYVYHSSDEIGVPVRSVLAAEPCEEDGLSGVQTGMLLFDKPQPWRNAYTRTLWQQGRFKRVKLSEMQEAGARYYCWVQPHEELESDIPGEPMWLVSATGAFVYLFVDDNDDLDGRAKDDGEEEVTALPAKHPLNRYFTARSRTVNTKKLIQYEALRPSTKAGVDEERDYTFMMLQLALVVCFASALPLSPAIALLAAFMELHSDLHRFLLIVQRPVAVSASGIGAWMQIIYGILFCSVPINTLVVVKGQGYKTYRDVSTTQQEVDAAMMLVVIKLVVLRVANALMSPRAGWVEEYVLRKEYETQSAAAVKHVAVDNGDEYVDRVRSTTT